MSLQDAVDVLSDQAAGRLVQSRSQLISAALALETAGLNTTSRDILDAAVGLNLLARGGDQLLDQKGRLRRPLYHVEQHRSCCGGSPGHAVRSR